MAELAASAYVVLGLLDRYGPATPYGLDQTIRASIGYFWGFPRSQLYAEAARLVRRGLVAEERESDGRRRRSISITDNGRDELRRWLDAPAGQPSEIRDVGLLQLFFAPCHPDPGETIAKVATQQAGAHRDQLALYEQLVAGGERPDGSPERATLELGLRFERLAVAFWSEVESDAARLGEGPATA